MARTATRAILAGRGRRVVDDRERLDAMDLGEHLAVPYVAVVYSVERPDGTWWRRAEYPELPGCAVEAPSATEAMDLLEQARVRYIVAAHARGESVPTPRPPLPAGVSGLSERSLRQILREVDAATPA